MPLDADQLDAFWAVVQAGTYAAAAERLFITQSAVTQRIQALEAALGARVFQRAGRTVALTEVGHQVVRHCRDLRQAEAALLKAVRGEGGLAGRLAVACGTAEGRSQVLPALAAIGREHPDLDLSLVLDDLADAGERLAHCQVDAVVGEVALNRRGLRSWTLSRVPYVLVASPALAAGWPDRPGADLLLTARAIDFAPQDRITLDHLALALPGGDLSGLRRHFVDDTRGILDWVLAGGGFSVLPEASVVGPVARGDLRVLHPEVKSLRPLYLTVPDGPLPAPVAALVEALINKDS